MPGGQHRPLDDEAIGAGLLDQAGPAAGMRRHARNADRNLGALDRRDPLADQLFADRGLVELLQQPIDPLARRLGDLLKHAGGVRVARLESIEVEHGHATETAHLDRKSHVHDPVHRRGENRDGELQRAQLKAAVDFLRIDRHPPGNEGDFVEAVGATGPLESAQLDSLAGLEGRGFQGRTHTHRRRLRNRVELKGYACTSIRGGFGGL